MNKRGKKKAEKRRRQMVHQLLDAVLDINGLEKRQRDRTGEMPAAHFDFAGHVGAVMIRVNKDGWTPGSDFDYDIWFDTCNTDEKACNRILAELREFRK